MTERIIACALRVPGHGVVALAPPARHSDVMIWARLCGIGMRAVADGQRGFVTSHARFLVPGDAMLIARSARQLYPLPGRGELFSDDLW